MATSNRPTATPTQHPVVAPTQWFEHPDHEANVAMLQSAVAELEVTVRNLQAQLAASASKLVGPGERMRASTRQAPVFFDLRWTGHAAPRTPRVLIARFELYVV